MKHFKRNFERSLICRFELILILLVGGMILPGCRTFQTSSIATRPFGGTLLATSWGWNGFLHPHEVEGAHLSLLEPYQPGKIPVVFIHGLLSAPGTWEQMILSLRANPEINKHYQFWVFQYPTGTSYLGSAHDLRRQLSETLQKLDPNHADPALSNMVLVGHSMGGLIAKLQVTDSGNELWNTVSAQPIENLKTDEQTKQEIQDTLFFKPLPVVNRVVFIATPHQGSYWSERPLGRLGRNLIAFPKTLQDDYQQLMGDNFNILKTPPSGQLPTSVDHLIPENPVIKATSRLPFSKQVSVHSIIGIGEWVPGRPEGDGVVTLTSAHLDGVASEQLVSATHSYIHRHPQTIQGVGGILLTHLQQFNLTKLHTKE